MGSATVHSLRVYPVKSCGAAELSTAYAGPRGLLSGAVTDRSWMLIDVENTFVSQRRKPELARVKVALVPDVQSPAAKIRLSVDGMPSLMLDSASVGYERQTVIIHGKESTGHLACNEASRWFSDYLKETVRVVYQKEGDVRVCNPDFAVSPGLDTVSFADGYPFLVTTLATLEKLNAQLDAPVPMDRFRPNIVIDCGEGDSEYHWKNLVIGDAALRLVKPCTRCVMVTVDQDKGKKTGKEPLASLARSYFLSQDVGKTHVQGAVFGENTIATRYGKISVGDSVTVTETKPGYNFRGN